MNIKTILQSFGTTVRQHGLRAAIVSMVGCARIRYREMTLGIRTEALIFPREMGVMNSDCFEYSATTYEFFDKILNELAIKPSEHVFIDYGAGMGRVVILAAQQPFKKVIGVEISEELVKTARENLEKSRSKLRCRDVQLFCSDATQFSPDPATSIVYFNNPFAGEILDAVLEKLHTLARSGHEMLLVCNQPNRSKFEDQIRMQDWLELIQDFPLADYRKCLVFRSSCGTESLPKVTTNEP